MRSIAERSRASRGRYQNRGFFARRLAERPRYQKGGAPFDKKTFIATLDGVVEVFYKASKRLF
jgi:hypothetical protein